MTITGDRERLIVDHMRLADFIAQQCQLKSHREDARQEAMIGLIQAADRYDAARSDSFAKFAQLRIRGQVLDYYRREPMIGNSRSSGYDVPRRIDRYQPSPDDEIDFLENIVDGSAPTPESRAIAITLFRLLDRHCAPRTVAMIRLWCDDWTMQEIANSYQVSMSRVYQIITRGLSLVRKSIRTRTEKA